MNALNLGRRGGQMTTLWGIVGEADIDVRNNILVANSQGETHGWHIIIRGYGHEWGGC